MSDPLIYQPTVNRAKSIGKNSRIGAFCDIGADVEIGRNCHIQCRVSISNGVIIGDNVFIGPNTTILNDKYPYSTRIKPPKIRNNAIIGGSVTIGPDVTISEGTIIGQGSNVIKSTHGGVYFGNPAEFKYTLKEYLEKKKRYEDYP